MKNILVIGCNGFIGKKLTTFLLKNECFVIGMDINEKFECNDKKNFKYYMLNYSNAELRKFKIDIIYYLSWVGVSTVDKNDPKKQFENINLTYSMLEFAAEIGVKKIIIPGSMSEFSKSQNLVSGYEQDSPSDLYAATKVAIRKIAYQFCLQNNISLNWLLITSVYSKDRLDSNLITYVVKNLLSNKCVECTKLEQKWDYISDNDLVVAMYLVGMKGEINKIYPIGSGYVNKLLYYVQFIAKYLQKEELLRIGVLPYKNDYIDNSTPNIFELKKLGFKANDFFTDEIVRIIESLRNEVNN